ncbi:ABC transporter ATP-binding protein [Spirochaetia bacterium 38H-sp]|uniref:ABC transporter ATP-binding protein n=1 Tax=Rarispira pelagica TaxID=3141764 RepID=A0ABU9UB20_9SPIR
MGFIVLEDVKKNYHLGKTIVHALKGISFSIEEGDFLSIVGPSGCGKTTLLNIIGCIDKPTSGNVLFDGRDVAGLSDDQEALMRLKNIGFIFQTFNLVPVLNVVENIELPLVLARIPAAERKKRVNFLVELVGLADFAEHKPDELSGGQRQRVAIARALVHKPRLIIADEPTANLDSVTGGHIMEEMKRLNKEEGVSFVFSTHDPAVMKYAKRTIRLKDGEMDHVS